MGDIIRTTKQEGILTVLLNKIVHWRILEEWKWGSSTLAAPHQIWWRETRESRNQFSQKKKKESRNQEGNEGAMTCHACHVTGYDLQFKKATKASLLYSSSLDSLFLSLQPWKQAKHMSLFLQSPCFDFFLRLPLVLSFLSSWSGGTYFFFNMREELNYYWASSKF